MTLFGIDISSYQGNNFNMAEVRAEGFDFAFCKVSEGSTYRDATWARNRDRAKAAGLLLAGYHYLTTDNVNQQAALLIDQLGDSTCPIMVDVENGSGSLGNYWNFVNAVNARGREVALSYIPRWWLQSNGGGDLSQVPGLISSSYVNGSGYASALYPGDASGNWAAYNGRTPDVLQFSDKGLVAGQSVDVNAYRGTRDQLAALLGVAGPAVAPAPPAAPAASNDGSEDDWAIISKQFKA